MVSGHLQREGPGAPFICMYCFCGLWPIHPLLTGFFLASEFLLLRDSNKSKELKSGTFCILILAKCVWKLFPVWLPFNRYVSMTPDYTEDRKTIWGKSSFKNNTEGRKEGRKEGERKGSMTLREEYFSLGRKVPPDCILFFFLRFCGRIPKTLLDLKCQPSWISEIWLWVLYEHCRAEAGPG